MSVLIVIFWISWLFLAYHLVGYGLILYLINKFRILKTKQTIQNSVYPKVTVLCPAYNEEKVIKEKIESFLALDYPADKISMIVISDDSTDATNDIVQQYTDRNISLVIQKPRAGKQSGHNLVLPMLDCDYVLSTDANSIFAPDAVKLMVHRILSDPALGMVTGELRLQKKGEQQSGEGLYWKYETFLKRMDSQFKTVICANGALFLIKREFFTPIDPQSGDDFERSLIVLKNKHYIAYEPLAVVTEDETQKASEEISRKIRIITQEWFAMQRHSVLLNPFRFPAVCFLLVSHKLIRWLFFFFILTGLLASGFLIKILFFRAVFVLQILVYIYGAIGLFMQKHNVRLPGASLLAYFIGMVYSSAIAFRNFMFKKSSFGLWKPIR